MADKLPKPIEINFANPKTGNPYGIGNSPFTGPFADTRNLDIWTRPGSARLNYALQGCMLTPTSATFTASSSTNILTFSSFVGGNSFGYDNGAYNQSYRAVTVSNTGGGLPGGLSASTVYFLIDVSPTTAKIATTLANAIAGTYITITSNGTGTQTITAVNMTLPKYVVYDSSPAGTGYYLQDDIGQIWNCNGNNFYLWYLITGNPVNNSTYGSADASATGNGLILFNNYLLVFKSYTIDVYGDITGTPSWTNSWKSILGTSGGDHFPYYNPINGVCYWSEYKDGGSLGSTSIPLGASGLGSLLQTNGNTAFAPGTSSTYTFVSAYSGGIFTFSLPTYNRITCMILVGSNLMLGTNFNLIYPWDTHSATYSLPLICQESNITTMVNIGNFLYYAAGNRGNIYFFNGYYSTRVAQVPPYITNIAVNTPTIFNMVKHNGRIYFGLSCLGCSGLWSFNPDIGVITMENINSKNSYTTSNPLTIGAIVSLSSEQVLFGWKDSDSGNVYGLDTQKPIVGTIFYYSLTGYAETSFYNIGTPNIPRRLQNYDIMLGNKLATGQSIQIFSRGDTSSSYSGTADAIFDYTTFGAVDSIKFPCGKDFINAQFKVVINTPASSTTTPQLNTIQIN